MDDPSALELLHVYRGRLRAAERGVIKMPERVVAGIRALVAGLEALRPETRIAIETHPQKWVFKESEGGTLVALIDFDETTEPR